VNNAFPNGNPDGDSETVNLALRFPGQVYYGVGNYNYNYYRDYDPITGRYLESDPIGLEGGLNT
jgi:RHS repeat-associated protein